MFLEKRQNSTQKEWHTSYELNSEDQARADQTIMLENCSEGRSIIKHGLMYPEMTSNFTE